MVQVTFSTRRGRRRRPVAAALAAGALLIAACGGGDDEEATGDEPAATEAPTAEASATATADSGFDTDSDTAAAPGGSDTALVVARGMDINSLDPSLAYCDTCQIYLTAVYETLIGLAEDNVTLEPRLATAWESNPEQTEFTFTLDPAATFADGTPVTSADVKFSWERLKALQGGSSYLASLIDTVDTPDPQTVVVTLSAPNSAFLAQVNAPYLGIINKALAEANGATTDVATDAAEPWFLANSAGSGPFQLASYTEGNELRLARNDAYWATPAAFPEVIMRETPQAVTQRQQLEQGEVDIAMQLSADVADRAQQPGRHRGAGAELQLRVRRAQPGRRRRRAAHPGGA